MQVSKANIKPLPRKHYSTDVEAEVLVEGETYDFVISVCGWAPNASRREVGQGWEPDHGMDHVESEAHLWIAEKIVSALAEQEKADG